MWGVRPLQLCLSELFDVAIIAAVLAAERVFGAEELGRTVLLGEVGLDGRLRPVRGILPATLAAQQAGFKRVIVPLRQAGEANLEAAAATASPPSTPQPHGQPATTTCWYPTAFCWRTRTNTPPNSWT